ncbi:MAG: NUDIX hydrolase [Geodermatophilaceae bacterium]
MRPRPSRSPCSSDSTGGAGIGADCTADHGAGPPRPWRRCGRLLVADPANRILLVPVDDGHSAYWDLPGGGLEPGEDSAQAALREVREETGYIVAPAALGGVCWRGDVVFWWCGRWHGSHQVVHRARLDRVSSPGPVRLTAEEQAMQGGARWWSLAEFESAGHSVAPLPVPADAFALLDGPAVTAGVIRWMGPASTKPAAATARRGLHLG